MTQNTVITQYIGTPIQGMKIEWTHDAKTQTTTNTLDAASELAFDITWNWHSLYLTTANTSRTTPDALEQTTGFIPAGSTTVIPTFILFLNPNLTDINSSDPAADTSINILAEPGAQSAENITWDGLYLPLEFAVSYGDLDSSDPADYPDEITMNWDQGTDWDFDVFYRGLTGSPTPADFGIDNSVATLAGPSFGGDIKSTTDTLLDGSRDATQASVVITDPPVCSEVWELYGSVVQCVQLTASGKRFFQGDQADSDTYDAPVGAAASTDLPVDFYLDYRKYQVLVGWDVSNNGSSSDPQLFVPTTYSEVDFGLFLEAPTYYEAGAAMLTTASAAILAMTIY